MVFMLPDCRHEVMGNSPVSSSRAIKGETHTIPKGNNVLLLNRVVVHLFRDGRLSLQEMGGPAVPASADPDVPLLWWQHLILVACPEDEEPDRDHGNDGDVVGRTQHFVRWNVCVW